MDIFVLILEIIIASIVLLIVVSAILIAFTTGFKPSGRQMGGVTCLFARQGQGKTFVASAFGLEKMRQGRAVFSNFPIISVCRRYCSLFWEKKLMKQNLRRCVIIWDEIQRDFWGRKFATFTEDDLAWFTSLGQREITIYLITQDIDNLDPVLKRVVDTYIEITKIEIPFLEIPILFVLREFQSLDDYLQYHRGFADPWHTERIWFNLDIANSYNTQFFAEDKRPVYQGINWIQLGKMQKPPIHFKPPTDYALTTKIKKKAYKILNTLYTTIIYYVEKIGRIERIRAIVRQVFRFRDGTKDYAQKCKVYLCEFARTIKKGKMR